MNTDAQHPRPVMPTLSDAELADMAQAALGWNGTLPPGAIRASASAGWVTLSGQVLWHYQRQDATECVRHLPGLAGVSNEITLGASGVGVTDAP